MRRVECSLLPSTPITFSFLAVDSFPNVIGAVQNTWIKLEIGVFPTQLGNLIIYT